MKIKGSDLEFEVRCEELGCFEDKEDLQDCFYCDKGEMYLMFKDRQFLLFPQAKPGDYIGNC